MKNSLFAHASFRSIGLRLAVVPLWLVLAAASYAQVPAQKPLLNTLGGGVAPNFMLTLDDSASMLFQHMPETLVTVGGFSVIHPIGTASIRMDPADTFTPGGPGSVQGGVNYFKGTVAAVPGSTNWRQKLLRSPDTNTLYYNPEIFYKPWAVSSFPLPMASATALAGRRNHSPVAAAYLDPVNPGGKGVANLTHVRSVSMRWCFQNTSVDCLIAGREDNMRYDPGLYYRLKQTAGVYLNPADSKNYTEFSINSSPYKPYTTKAAARTDCRVDRSAVPHCTQAEERQNFANWFTYYRSRNLLARGALMEAFSSVGNTIRVGFGRINKASANVDGVDTPVIESEIATYGGGGVRAFDPVRKQQLFKWLEDLPAQGSTPLPAALATVGDYYSRVDAKGPYTDNPGKSGNAVADNKTCRRSYQLMLTDGYWNGTTPNMGDQDSTAGVVIPGGSYALPANTPPYSDGISDTLADVAMKYWKTDLQPAIDNKVVASSADPTYWQNMTNFMVGLGVRGSLDPATDLPALALPVNSPGKKVWPAPSPTVALPANIDDLWHAALNSRGTYFSAKDPATLASAVTGALAEAQGARGATAGVATVSSVLQSGNRKYVPIYNGHVWSGDIAAQTLDANGQAAAAVWHASARVPSHQARNIYTWDTRAVAPLSASKNYAVPFKWTSLSAQNQASLVSGSNALVEFLRGDHRQEVSATQPLMPYRERKDTSGAPFVLGDFVNSNPVLVKGLFDGAYGGLRLGGSNGYQLFTAAKSTRDAVLFVGGNDGMLHGFTDVNSANTASTDGQEVFAYVPRAVYSNLSKLSDPAYGSTGVPHRYFVDGPQNEADAYVAGPAYPAFGGQPACVAGATCWRNFLLGSLGAGGRAVYALDVTSSPVLNAANLRWEISSQTEADLGYVMAPIEVGVLPNGRWVAIFGNGYASDRGYATLFVVDLATAAVTKLSVGAPGGNGLGGVAVLRNARGEIASLYAGDLKGQLWKFDYSSDSVPFVVSGGSALFLATDSGGHVQAITQPPSLFNHSKGGKIIVFGSGQLFSEADGLSTDPQSIYGVWDKPGDNMARPFARGLLQSRSLAAVNGTGLAASSVFYTLTGESVDVARQRGWQVDLSTILNGGRVVYPTQAISSTLVLVTAVAPASAAAACASRSGVSVDIVFNVEEGMPAKDRLFDTTGEAEVNGSDFLVSGLLSDTVGRRAIVRAVGGAGGTASGLVCQSGFHRVSLQTASSQSMICVADDAAIATPRPFDRVWRRIINPPIR